MSTLREDNATASKGDREPVDPRAYQLEMLAESMRKNIIVAMDTGSGKTHIALLRIAAELDRCGPEKLVWFLCPTVVLAQQQYDYFEKHLRCVQIRILTGNDGVDRWGEKQIWDDVLKDINLVVSTYQILLDALVHGFISMRRLALLIHDECHNCTKESSPNRIMQEFYHPKHRLMDEVPHILGLSASPIISSKLGGLEKIEQNMHALSKTPKLHREELLRYVHLPEMKTLIYPESVSGSENPPLLKGLLRTYSELDIRSDPYVVKLRAASHGGYSEQLRNALLSRKTYCQDQMKSLCGMAINVFEELGSWAVELYISICLQNFQSRRVPSIANFESLDEDERAYLLRAFAPLFDSRVDDQRSPEDSELSPKVRLLLDCLNAEVGPGFAGLVFVQTRASVRLIAHLVSIHTRTKDRLIVGTFVGTSNHHKRKSNIGEVHNVLDQGETLDDLRYGRKNLIITTSVLEEGIDVSATNAVICFEKPANLKSFIQRRGRARSAKSKYIIMFREDYQKNILHTWRQLEDNMKQMYMDDMRRLEEIRQQEDEEEGGEVFKIESTGAQMSLRDSVRHLDHWCSVLPTTQYADLRPVYSFEHHSDRTHVRARVLLPKSVDKTVREVLGGSWWKTEKFAKRDAAFEAYIALYHAGLVNDHLLPLIPNDEAALKAYSDIEKRPGLVTVKEKLSPWPKVAAAWQTGSTRFQSMIKFSIGQLVVPMRMISPFTLPSLSRLTLYPENDLVVHVDFDPIAGAEYTGDIKVSDTITMLLLFSIYRSRMASDRRGFPILFEPFIGVAEREKWLAEVTGTRPASALLAESSVCEQTGIVRDLSMNGVPYTFSGVTYQPVEINGAQAEGSAEPEMELAPFLAVSKLSKRADFLHPVVDNKDTKKTRVTKYLAPNTCTVDNLPFTHSQCAMYIPCVMHHVEAALIIEHLCNSLLSSIHFKNHHLVATAITASSAREAYNYQSLEFMGDSCLKVYATLNLMAMHLNWHEGYLTQKKGYIVSNGRLALAAQQTGLDQYIITKEFTGYKWKPLYNEDLLQSQPTKAREMSTKTLADVVEALLGAAFVDGGFPKVLACLSIFLPDVPWHSLSDCREVLHKVAIPNEASLFPHFFSHLEMLINHRFNTKSLLLEALTHPSHLGPDNTPSYERLEFMGDALLDIIITTRVFQHRSSLKPFRMHLLRTALVNADFLAFVGMRHFISVARTNLPPKDPGTTTFASESVVNLSIWHFMRHGHSAELIKAQASCHARFVDLQPAISEALSNGASYPWTLLTALAPGKFFSDIIESIIAAIYIDSAGSLAACETFLTVLGILPYVDRALDSGISVMHPKEELGVAAGNEKVRYEVAVLDDSVGEQEGRPGYKCKVSVGQLEVAVVFGARSRIEAETRAAEEALVVLKQHPGGLAIPLEDQHLEQEKVRRKNPMLDDDDEGEEEYVDAVDVLDEVELKDDGLCVEQDVDEGVGEEKGHDVRMGGCLSL
ncbi:Dicer-like protein 2 [Xylographa soralifera]|nr:Dicer-like protein 2 [Xylographa soralifera]